MIMDHKIILYFNHFLGLKIFAGTSDKSFRVKSKELSEQSITTPAESDNSFALKVTYIQDSKIAIKFEGNCLKQDESISYS